MRLSIPPPPTTTVRFLLFLFLFYCCCCSFQTATVHYDERTEHNNIAVVLEPLAWPVTTTRPTHPPPIYNSIVCPAALRVEREFNGLRGDDGDGGGGTYNQTGYAPEEYCRRRRRRRTVDDIYFILIYIQKASASQVYQYPLLRGLRYYYCKHIGSTREQQQNIVCLLMFGYPWHCQQVQRL